MPLHYEPDRARHIAIIRGEGRVSFEDCAAVVAQQHAHVSWRLHELNDFRGAELAMSSAESERLARMNIDLYSEVRGIRIAMVTDSQLAYGISRMFAAYLGDRLEYRIFTDYDEALAWIGEAAERESD